MGCLPCGRRRRSRGPPEKGVCVMEVLGNGDFWMILSGVVSVLGLYLAMRADLRREIGGLRADMEKRFDEVDRKFEEVDRKFEQVNRKFEEVHAELQTIRQRLTEVEQKLREVDRKFVEVDQKFAEVRAAIAGLREHIDGVEKRLGIRIDRMGERVDRVEAQLGRRIDRMEDRAREDHKEVVAEVANLKAEVSALGARLDERSYPRLLKSVREGPAEYSDQEPQEAD